MDSDNFVSIFTDGSCTPKRSGWGVVIEKGRFSTIYKGEKPGATNNEMELFAFKVALEKGLEMNTPFSITSDSKYSLCTFFSPTKSEKDFEEYDSSKMSGWIKNWKDVHTRKNGVLILEIQSLIKTLQSKKRTFKIFWARGHHLCRGNHLADLCAKGEDENTFLEGYI